MGLGLFSNKQYLLERDLLRRASSGDAQASKELILMLSPPAFSLAWRMLGGREDAEDVVQEAFIRLWRNADSFSGNSKLLTYFYSIVSNLCLDRMKSNSRASFDDFDENVHRSTESFELEMHDFLRVECIQKAVDALTPKQRMAIMMWAYQDLTAQQIGIAMNMSKNGIDQLLYRAKLKLKEELTGGVK